MKRATRTLLAATAALAATTLVAATMTPATADDHARRAPKKDPRATPFAMRAQAYGSSVRGGSVPVSSGATAYEGFGCTNKAGIERTNQLADVTLPSIGTISGLKTHVWTSREGKVVSSWAQNTIGKVVLSDSPLGTLSLDAVSTTARAYHDGTTFQTYTHTDVAKLSFKGPVGPAQTFPVPSPGKPVTIPGVARLAVGTSWTPRTVNGARAFADGIKIRLLPTNTVVRVAHAIAQIGQLQSGIFSGSSYAVSGTAAGDIVNLGRNPLLQMQCQGTAGEVKTRQLAAIDLGGQAEITAARSEQMAEQTSTRAAGFERSRVASIRLGDQLRIEGIVGQANVRRDGPGLKTLTTSTTGTTIGAIYVNGQIQKFPETGVLEIPGVAKIESKVVERLRFGIGVTALRITVLDGTGAVINLGNAQFQVKPIPVPKKKTKK